MALEDLPPVPKVNIKKLELLRSQFYQVTSKYLNCEITVQTASRMTYSIHMLLNERYSRDRVFQSLVQHTGTIITPKFAATLAMQLAARHTEMNNNILVLFDKPVRNEWVAFEVDKAVETVWQESQAGVDMTLMCLTGHPAGYRLNKKFPAKWLNYLAYQVGFNRRIQYDFDHRHFIGLRFWGYLFPKDEDFDFSNWSVDNAMKKDNAIIIGRRNRYNIDFEYKEDSPKNCPYDLNTDCFSCRKLRTECSASLHR